MTQETLEEQELLESLESMTRNAVLNLQEAEQGLFGTTLSQLIGSYKITRFPLRVQVEMAHQSFLVLKELSESLGVRIEGADDPQSGHLQLAFSASVMRDHYREGSARQSLVFSFYDLFGPTEAKVPSLVGEDLELFYFSVYAAIVEEHQLVYSTEYYLDCRDLSPFCKSNGGYSGPNPSSFKKSTVPRDRGELLPLLERLSRDPLRDFLIDMIRESSEQGLWLYSSVNRLNRTADLYVVYPLSVSDFLKKEKKGFRYAFHWRVWTRI